MAQKINVGILGATGAVGQRFVQLLTNHPYFDVTVLAASERSAGKPYREATHWILTTPMPDYAAEMTVEPISTKLNCQLLFSALPTASAREWEGQLAAAGYAIFSNAGAHRMDADVPLLLPEVNAAHVALLARQKANRGWERGFIVTNPNCTIMPMTMALTPLHAQFGVTQVIATSMQAVSGAGYPGVPSLDIIDNILPFVAESEEVKMATEPNKIMGTLGDNTTIQTAGIAISAHCNRVPVSDGHLVTVSAKFKETPSLGDVMEAWQTWEPEPQQLKLPSAPQPPLVIHTAPNRPQPRLDRDAGRGMAASVGRLRPCEVLDVRFIALAHNTVRGAAGGSVLNAELMVAQGLLDAFKAEADTHVPA